MRSPSTGWRFSAARSSRRSRATATSRRSSPRPGARSRATWSSSAPGCARIRCSPSAPGSRSTTGSSATQRLETSAAGIFAAGDVCSYDSVVHGRRLRVEHWDVALQQGRHVARAMLGSAEPYREIPYFFSDLADWASMEYVGPAYEWDEVIWRGEREAGRVQRLVSRGRGGQGRARRRALRGPDPRAHPDRDRGGHVGARGGACGPGFRARVDRAIRATGPLCFARAVGRPASVAPWCNGSTPRSGRGSWGSNPWGAVTTSGLRGG